MLLSPLNSNLLRSSSPTMAVQAHLSSENLGFSMPPINDGFLSNQNHQHYCFINHLHTGDGVGGGGGFQNGVGFSNQSIPFLPQSLASEIEMQRREMDLYLHLQSARLKQAVEQQRKQQMAVLISGLETTAAALVRQKDQDLAKVKERTRELEVCLRRAEMEIEEWQRVSKEKEAMVISLNQMLLQAKERLLTSEAEDAESVNECEDSSTNDRGKGRIGFCKGCNHRSSCMVLLPCKHLCACRFCEPLLEICPVCQSVKEASIEVLLQ